MAQKRMFSLSVVDTDNFLEMPISSRLLYYELGMRADDDGFVSNWKKILAFTNLTMDDLRVLVAKKFIIPFESGIIVIRHWRMNNYLQNDRKKDTNYQDELNELEISKNGVYYLKENAENKRFEEICIQNGYELDTQYSIDKNSIDKNSIDIYSRESLDNASEMTKQIIAYLNSCIGSNYKNTTKATQHKINARLKEGFTFKDFKTVIDKKVKEWANTDMEKYLRPETLFGTKFESYLNQKERELTTDDVAKTMNWEEFY